MATASITPTPLHSREAGDQSERQVTLSSKEKKYDRQLRLWAASGQEALENANILLLNSGSGNVGIETLKNLILPGVGSFTIIDEAVVREQDLGVNFFLTEDSLGKSRAEESCNYLRELNPEVMGRAVQKSVEMFIRIPNNLDSYTLILLIGPVRSSDLEKLTTWSSECSRPLFYIHSIGFYSHFSVQLPAHFPCVDTHPEPESTEDLRLLKPWPELIDFMRVKTRDLDTISDHEHGHIPYLLLLLYNLEIWGESHDGKSPSGFQEKKAFKAQVEEGARKSSAEGAGENFAEAVKAVNKSLNPPEIASGLHEVFEAEECKTPTASSSSFWIIANAIHDFYRRHEVLPLPGAVPDMKAQSADYIQLQNIYKTKARKDLSEVVDKVRGTESELMKDVSIDEREVEAFCKGAASVRLISGRPTMPIKSPSMVDWGDRANSLAQELNDEKSLFLLYVCFLAYDCLADRLSSRDASQSIYHSLYCADFLEELIKQSGIVIEKEAVMERMENFSQEMQRASDGELHNISALTGGMVAQEVIKVITKQYIPLDNTCVFDGIASKLRLVENQYGAFIGAHIQDSAVNPVSWLEGMISKPSTAGVRASAVSAARSRPAVSSTLQQFKNSSDLASLFELGAQDVFMAIPWMLDRAGAFNLFNLPERIDNILGLHDGGSIIAEATSNKTLNMSSHAITGLASAQRTAAPIQGHTAETTGGVFSFAGLQHFRSFGGVFTYMTSKWAFACLTLAIVLNRTHAYASGRRPVRLTWPVRLALRILPIILFSYHAPSLLQAIRCQTSPDYSVLRYSTHDKKLDFSEDGGFLYRLSSRLLPWQSDQESCLAVGMARPDQGTAPPLGSLSLLWPIFKSICISQFVETLSSSVQGLHPMTETGMSVFEHSLAFAEAEALVASQLGMTPWGFPKNGFPRNGTESSGETRIMDLASLSTLYNRMNTPPEVLLMALISSFNVLSTHILAVLGQKDRFRLLNTGIWGLCFMGSFAWGFLSWKPEAGIDAVILRFPTVCIVGFIPHLLILIGIFFCACIYLLALLLAVLSPPDGLPEPRSLKERLRNAHENLQVHRQIGSLQARMQDDFYSTLIKLGFSILTIASEAVFLNEGRRIGVAMWTWLEEQRLKELENARQPFDNVFGDGLADRIGLIEERALQSANTGKVWRSGYDRERTTKILKARGQGLYSQHGTDGVGALQRGGRYLMAWEFFRSIFWVWLRCFLAVVAKILDVAGIPSTALQPRKKTREENGPVQDKDSPPRQPGTIDFWLLSDDGILSLPENDNIDVEKETKKRLRAASDRWGGKEERKLDSTLYKWWTHGGWWGERDDSGTYQALDTEDDEDTTSIISESTAHDTAWESEDDGYQTPTQRRPEPYRARSPSLDPVTDHTIDATHLARLLNPKDPDARQEARMLAAHLSSPTILTRSQYRASETLDHAHLLTSTRYRPPGFTPSLPNGRLTPSEEAEILEFLILSRRATNTQPAGASWRDGADGLGSGGPQCVVCQSEPRTILAWPCRCLSLCEECRVSLAMNNFGTCVCCRTEVVGFSRLFVP